MWVRRQFVRETQLCDNPIMSIRLPSASLLILSMFVAELSSSQGFSIDAASPGVPGVSQIGLLFEGPVGGPPIESYIFPVAPDDEVNAISFGTGSPTKTFHFSVDRLISPAEVPGGG